MYVMNYKTNGPVNAHLRSAVYTNNLNIMKNSHSKGADETLVPFCFSE